MFFTKYGKWSFGRVFATHCPPSVKAWHLVRLCWTFVTWQVDGGVNDFILVTLTLIYPNQFRYSFLHYQKKGICPIVVSVWVVQKQNPVVQNQMPCKSGGKILSSVQKPDNLELRWVQTAFYGMSFLTRRSVMISTVRGSLVRTNNRISQIPSSYNRLLQWTSIQKQEKLGYLIVYFHLIIC